MSEDFGKVYVARGIITIHQGKQNVIDFEKDEKVRVTNSFVSVYNIHFMRKTFDNITLVNDNNLTLLRKTATN